MDKRELAFMGKITAGVTHEMNNVLAVIKESTGLMEDILTLTGSGEFKHRDKFLRTLSSLSGQIARGVELSRRLNRFAHSMDEPVAALDLNELLAQLHYLTARFARLRQVDFELAPPSGSYLIRTDPFRALMVLVALVEGVLRRCAPAGALVLSGGQEGGRLAIRITGRSEGPIESPDMRWDELSDVISDLRVTVEDSGGLDARVLFPGE